jgi:phosphoribosyl 1,2-cyclic phosphodiesterase
MIKFLIVGSGSKGNATLVYDEHTMFQIDMGLPLKRINAALGTIHAGLDDIKAIFITHDHSDHIGTLDLLPYSVKRFASKDTLKDHYNEMAIGSIVTLGDFKITSFSVSHDATNPVGYLIRNKDESLVYITDCGYLTDSNLAMIKNKTYYIFESNHDLKMLYASHRPLILKQRIHSDVGHLSNTDSASYLRDSVGPSTKAIYLAHLSEECNTEEAALLTYKRIFNDAKEDLSGIKIIPAKQWEMVKGGDE